MLENKLVLFLLMKTVSLSFSGLVIDLYKHRHARAQAYSPPPLPHPPPPPTHTHTHTQDIYKQAGIEREGGGVGEGGKEGGGGPETDRVTETNAHFDIANPVVQALAEKEGLQTHRIIHIFHHLSDIEKQPNKDAAANFGREKLDSDKIQE